MLVAGIGNLFCSDDGFGPEVARRLGSRVPPGVRVVDYGIRGTHLAYDLLDRYDVLVVVDAAPVGEAAGDLALLEVGRDELDERDLGPGAFDAHAMDPVAVLASLDRLGGTLPRTYVVGCRPATTEEGIGLSDPVAAAVPLAVEAVSRLLEDLLVGGRA